jgi:hypothetical protein
VRWWIEGARINSELGLARLRGGYHSPLMQTFAQLCHAHFAATTSGPDKSRQAAPRKAKKQPPKQKRRR